MKVRIKGEEKYEENTKNKLHYECQLDRCILQYDLPILYSKITRLNNKFLKEVKRDISTK